MYFEIFVLTHDFLASFTIVQNELRVAQNEIA